MSVKNADSVNGGNNANVTCGYYTITGRHRNCEIGLCDKYQPRKKKKK